MEPLESVGGMIVTSRRISEFEKRRIRNVLLKKNEEENAKSNLVNISRSVGDALGQ